MPRQYSSSVRRQIVARLRSGEPVARAAAEGVIEMVTIGTRMGQSRQLLELVRGRDRVWCTVGVHPGCQQARRGRSRRFSLTLGAPTGQTAHRASWEATSHRLRARFFVANKSRLQGSPPS